MTYREAQGVPPELPSQPKHAEFEGFAPLQSNTTYCPNQFFDVVLPHFARGVVRLVGYAIYRTFAWSDRDGRPMSDQHKVSYRELIEKAGISRGALKEVIEQAIRRNLLHCVKQGHASHAGIEAESSVFELKWHNGEYSTDPALFQGFFEGTGNRTYIPNQFFIRLLPNETLSVLKVVGSIIRFSIGFEVKRGFRRQQAALSYADIQRYSGIVNPTHLASALKHALAANYIARIEEGRFDPNAGRESKAAVYALKWATDAIESTETGSKRIAVERVAGDETGSERIVDERFKKDSESGSEKRTAKRFKKDSGIEIKQTNKTSKQQQQAAAAPIDSEDRAAYRRLIEIGFDQVTSVRLASSRSLEHIERQIAWMSKRNPTRNALGMLRRAIEEDWPGPVNLAVELSAEHSAAAVFARHFYAGFADNALTPVATPCSADLAAADPLVKALLQVWPDTTQVEAWGRQFGKHAAEQQGANKRPMSLSFAVRLLGDAFVVWARRDRERHRQQTAQVKREAHEARFKGDYRRYLLACEVRLQEQDPARYREFLAYREERRKELLRFARSGAQSALMRGFETEGARLEDLRVFYSPDVLDFQGWDAHHNHETLPA
jgi:hypothetical protein